MKRALFIVGIYGLLAMCLALASNTILPIEGFGTALIWAAVAILLGLPLPIYYFHSDFATALLWTAVATLVGFPLAICFLRLYPNKRSE